MDVEHVRVRNPVGREFTESAEIAVSLVSRGFGKTEGIPVANFTIASTPRTFDQASNEWKDGETLFIRAKVWRDVAENVAASLTMGSRVVVSGRLKPRTYETKAGEKRTVVELEVDEVALSIRYMAATPAGVQGGRQAASRSNSQSGQHADETVTEPGSYADDDPWFGKKATSEGINTDT